MTTLLLLTLMVTPVELVIASDEPGLADVDSAAPTPESASPVDSAPTPQPKPSLPPAVVAASPATPTGAPGSVVVAAGTGVLTVSTLAALTAAVAVHLVPLQVSGRPNPWVTSSGLVVSLGVHLALSHLTLPWLASVLRPANDVATLREAAWRSSRWAMLAGAVGAATSFVGAGLEESGFGRGQGVMLTGLLVTVASLVAFDILESLGAWGVLR